MAEAGRKIDPVVDEAARVYDALIRFAKRELAKIRLYNPDIVIPGTGGSAEDLASATILKLFARGWTPGAGGENILPLGRVILRNHLTDLLRSSAHRTNVSLDSEGFDKREELRVEPVFEKLIEMQSVIEKVKARLTNEMEKKYLDELSAGTRKRKEFAENLGIPPEEVDNIQKRLIYKAELMRDLL
jgi:DNA-directed RNA polymerase specialized sigma24 family protein